MSTGAKVMQILFIIAGVVSIGLGTLGSMVEGDEKVNAEWTCYPPTQAQPAQSCRGETKTGSSQQVPMNFILAGIGLEIAAAAIAAGSRSSQPAPQPTAYPMPSQPAYPPRPTSQPGQPQPTWPS